MLVGLQGSGKTTTCREARAAPAQGAGQEAAARRRRPPAPRRDRPARVARQADRASRSTARTPAATRSQVVQARGSQAAKTPATTSSSSTPPAGCTSTTTLMDELAATCATRPSPHEVLLVLDAMTGQDAVNVAPRRSTSTLAVDGVILTKLDGDARGGAALSIKRRHRQARSSSSASARSSTHSRSSIPTGSPAASSAWATS